MSDKKKKYVAYYRVSTQQQGVSGLGLESQERDVIAYTKGELIAVYTDIESGKGSNRQELLNALDHCKREDATLVVAKLDRLSRNLHFITYLMESKVKFVCCDMPEANEFTIHIFAALAEQERKMISQRTKNALKEAKNNGKQLGNPKLSNELYRQQHCDKMRSARQPKEYPRAVTNTIKLMKDKGVSFKSIADELNTHGRKEKYNDVQVFRIYNKMIIKH